VGAHEGASDEKGRRQCHTHISTIPTPFQRTGPHGNSLTMTILTEEASNTRKQGKGGTVQLVTLSSLSAGEPGVKLPAAILISVGLTGLTNRRPEMEGMDISSSVSQKKQLHKGHGDINHN